MSMRIPVSAAVAIFLAAASAALSSAPQNSCEYHVSPVWLELDGSQQSGFVNVETQPGCAWTVDTSVSPFSDSRWLHIGTAGGSGSGIVPYSIDAMPSSNDVPLRQGFIRVRWNTPTAGQNVIVTQAIGTCTAIPYPGILSVRTFGWKGGGSYFEVLADPPFSGPWRVTGSPDWVAFTQPAQGILGYGDGGTSFAVGTNLSTSPRDGIVTFCRQTVALHQSGRSINTGDAVPADFDGDGIADLAVYRPSTGTWYALPSSAGYSYDRSFSRQVNGYNGIPVPGDFDGDNRAEIAVSNSGTWQVRHSSDDYSAQTQSVFADPDTYGSGLPVNAVPLLADFNGDSLADFVTWWQDTGNWAVTTTNHQRPTKLPDHYPDEYNGHYQWGLPGDVPVPADFDGDRFADLAVWRPSNGTWYIRLSTEDYSKTTARVYQWGLPGDQPITGDFDGDGRTDLAVWRPSDGAWYIVYSSVGLDPGAMTRIQWGLPGDIPVPNDYDGDGRTDLAVWRPSDGTWYLLLSSKQYSYAESRSYQWGLPGDVPLSARVIRPQ